MTLEREPQPVGQEPGTSEPVYLDTPKVSTLFGIMSKEHVRQRSLKKLMDKPRI